MKQVIIFTVPGEPIGQKRHRTVRMKDGSNRNYDPSSSDKTDFKWMAYNNRPQVPLDCPVRLDVIFYFSRPKSHYGTGSNSHKLKPNAPEWKISKPDFDNCVKFVMDALNKVYWRDDSVICAGNIEKKYSAEPRVEVTVTEL